MSGDNTTTPLTPHDRLTPSADGAASSGAGSPPASSCGATPTGGGGGGGGGRWDIEADGTGRTAAAPRAAADPLPSPSDLPPAPLHPSPSPWPPAATRWPTLSSSVDDGGDPATRFTLLHELGRGSYGVVYAARDRVAGGVVAVKVVPARGGADARALAREVAALRSASHAAVVGIVGAWRRPASGDVWIAMELCAGGSVADALAARRSPLPEPAIAHVVAGALAGIAHLHSSGKVRSGVGWRVGAARNGARSALSQSLPSSSLTL